MDVELTLRDIFEGALARHLEIEDCSLTFVALREEDIRGVLLLLDTCEHWNVIPVEAGGKVNGYCEACREQLYADMPPQPSNVTIDGDWLGPPPFSRDALAIIRAAEAAANKEGDQF
jgi:hypothetical protein